MEAPLTVLQEVALMPVLLQGRDLHPRLLDGVRGGDDQREAAGRGRALLRHHQDRLQHGDGKCIFSTLILGLSFKKCTSKMANKMTGCFEKSTLA